jgi:beta-glucosidase
MSEMVIIKQLVKENFMKSQFTPLPQFSIKLYLNLFLILVCSFYFIGCDTGNNPVDQLPIPTVASNDPAIVPTARDAAWIIRHETQLVASLENDAKIIFIGDSITDLWDDVGIASWNELQSRYNNIINLGVSGDQTQHVLWRLTHGEFPNGINPENVVLMIGTNNSGGNFLPESVAAGIGEIIKTINRVSPSTKITLLSIFPRGAAINANRIINTYVNNIIKTYDGHLNVSYYDFGPYFMEENGDLKDGLFTDGLHLNAAGFAVWKDALIEILG